MRHQDKARFNMVEQQIRPWGVHDMRVLEQLTKVKREQYVPAQHRSLAFMDLEIPLSKDARMWPPKLEAHALQALDLKPDDKVLEIGTGSGYFTALLASLAAHVTSVEIDPVLAAHAAQQLARHHVVNVTLETGDAAQGWGDQQYDAIVVTGSLPLLPERLRAQLKVGGRMFAILGEGSAMQATRITRLDSETYERKALFEISVPALVNAPRPSHFVF